MRFAAEHGPCAASMVFLVVDAQHAYRRALDHGAELADPTDSTRALDVPAIRGIGNSLLYFLDRYGAKGSPFTAESTWTGEPDPSTRARDYIDHLTLNVGRGRAREER